MGTHIVCGVQFQVVLLLRRVGSPEYNIGPFGVSHGYFFYVPEISGNLGRGSPQSGPFQVRLGSV